MTMPMRLFACIPTYYPTAQFARGGLKWMRLADLSAAKARLQVTSRLDRLFRVRNKPCQPLELKSGVHHNITNSRLPTPDSRLPSPSQKASDRVLPPAEMPSHEPDSMSPLLQVAPQMLHAVCPPLFLFPSALLHALPHCLTALPPCCLTRLP